MSELTSQFSNLLQPYMVGQLYLSQGGVKRPSLDPPLVFSIIFPYGYDTIFEGGVSHTSLAAGQFPANANRIVSPMEAGMPTGAAMFTSTIGSTFHRAANVRMGLLSNRNEAPPILDPVEYVVEYSFGYDTRRNRYKIARFSNSTLWGPGTNICLHTCGIDRGWRVIQSRVNFIITYDETVNVGVSVTGSHLSTVNFLGLQEQSDDTLVEAVLAFNFRTNRVKIFPTPENVDGDPVLCSLSNKLCCSYFHEGTLKIFEARLDESWQLMILINSLPDPGVPQEY